MLLQRVVSLALVLVGFGAGWLARGSEVPEAEAAKLTTNYCLHGGSFGNTVVFNPSPTASARFDYQRFGSGGGLIDQEAGVEIGRRGMLLIGGQPTVAVSSRDTLLVDATARSGEAIHQVACLRAK